MSEIKRQRKNAALHAVYYHKSTNVYDISKRVQYNWQHPGQAHTRKSEVLVDPATITLIVKAVIGIARLIQSCRKSSEEAVQMAFDVDNPETGIYSQIENNRRNRRLMKKAIRREIGWWQWWWHGEDITKAIVETGKYMTPQEMADILKESKNYK